MYAVEFLIGMEQSKIYTYFLILCYGKDIFPAVFLIFRKDIKFCILSFIARQFTEVSCF
jgi:hypothetical protein